MIRLRFLIALVLTALLALAATSAYLFISSINDCTVSSWSDARVANHRGLTLKQVHLLQTQRGLTNLDLCRMPQDKIERALFRSENPKPDHPGEAVAFRLMQMKDENGFIPPDGLAIAQEHTRQMQKAWLLPGNYSDASGDNSSSDLELQNMPVDSSSTGLTTAGWVWLGPGNIGGRVRSIIIHPTSPNRMWAGSVSGGIWYTSNGGTSWSIVNDFMVNLAVSTLIIDPTNPDTMYAGTGEGTFNGDYIRGAGVFKSTDGGIVWTQLASTTSHEWYFVNRLAISPDGNTLLAATRTSGIWRSTNGGSSWIKVSGVIDWIDIDFHPTDNNKAVAGGYSGKAYFSTNGGQTWNASTGIGSNTDRVELAYAPSSPNIVYASVDRNSGEIYKSSDFGQIFSLVNTGNYFLGNQGWYDSIIWIDPTNANFLVVGGIDLWRSTNGGTTLTKISTWYYAPNSAHGDHHAIVNHPGFNGTSNTTVFFGNDGGIYKAANIYTANAKPSLNGWQELNNTLGITQFYGAAGNVASGVILGGTQDNGTLRYSGTTEGWTEAFGGDGGYCASDPTNSNYFYGEYVYLNILRSSNGGVSMNYISGQYWDGNDWVWKSVPYTIPDAQNFTANFIAPFMLDPYNTNRLLAGGETLWRTNDAKTANTTFSGPSWASIKSSIGSNISAIAIQPDNSDIIWVGHNNGNVYLSTNGTASTPSWTQMDLNPSTLPNRFITRLTIDPLDSNIVFVTFGGFSAGNVWRTTNRGVSWSNVSGSGVTGLPNVPVRSLVIHPDNSGYLYVGTEVGIFSSLDSGANWTVPHIGPSNVSVDELFWMDHKLVAVTHGRGLYQIDLSQSQIFLPVIFRSIITP